MSVVEIIKAKFIRIMHKKVRDRRRLEKLDREFIALLREKKFVAPAREVEIGVRLIQIRDEYDKLMGIDDASEELLIKYAYELC